MTNEWIQKVLAGNTNAFRFIIREHKDRAFTVAISIVKDESIAKDAVQAAFIKSYENLESYRGDAKFSTWLHRIVVNEALKRHQKEQRKDAAINKLTQEEAAVTDNKTVSNIDMQHQQFYIKKALTIMPSNYSLALRLFYLEEYDINEITNITSWTKSNTKVILHRARKKMKEILFETFNLNKESLY